MQSISAGLQNFVVRREVPSRIQNRVRLVASVVVAKLLLGSGIARAQTITVGATGSTSDAPIYNALEGATAKPEDDETSAAKMVCEAKSWAHPDSTCVARKPRRVWVPAATNGPGDRESSNWATRCTIRRNEHGAPFLPRLL